LRQYITGPSVDDRPDAQISRFGLPGVVTPPPPKFDPFTGFQSGKWGLGRSRPVGPNPAPQGTAPMRETLSPLHRVVRVRLAPGS
jgi:hypothetical protein